VLAALRFLRDRPATWRAREDFAHGVVGRLNRAKRDDLPTAREYASAVHVAEMLHFTSRKLVALYAGMMH
jgi:hypothetical protein